MIGNMQKRKAVIIALGLAACINALADNGNSAGNKGSYPSMNATPSSENTGTQPIVIQMSPTADASNQSNHDSRSAQSLVIEKRKHRHYGRYSRANRVKIPATPSLNFVINPRYKDSAKIRKLYRLLQIHDSPDTIHFVTSRVLADANHRDYIYYIQPRSFMDILNYLSHAVQVTPDLIRMGYVDAPQLPNGKYFNPTEMTKGLLSIHMSKHLPKSNVNVAVYYRKHWYWIADNDIDSKRAFRIAQEIFNMQAGEFPKQGPVLTIPVAR